MRRAYEAIQLAGKERALRESSDKTSPARVSAPDGLEESLLVAYRRIESMLQEEPGRIVAFSGVPNGDDCSRMLNVLARAIAYRLRKRVLLLGADTEADAGIALSSERLREISGKRLGETRPELGGGLGEPVLVTRRVNTMELVLPLMVDGDALKETVDTWRQDYDLVLLDVPPASESVCTELLCSICDGVVLVVEAEHARSKELERVIERIKVQKGRILGAVINKQRRYIPEFIQRFL